MPSIRVNRAPIRDVNRVGRALLIIMERYSTRFAWLEGSRVISIMFFFFIFLYPALLRGNIILDFGFFCVSNYSCASGT